MGARGVVLHRALQTRALLLVSVAVLVVTQVALSRAAL